MKNVLTIAGSDNSGGAGIQADLKTFCAHGVYGMSVITAVTAQNTQRVFAVQDITPQVIALQINAIFDDIGVDGLKIGMVSQVETINIIGERLSHYKPANVVLDPVMVSKSGYHLLQPEAKEALKKILLPMALVATPNIPEAEVITGETVSSLKDMEKAALMIHKMGPRYVLLKGGHLTDSATDILFDGAGFRYYKASRIQTRNTHGTGCTLSAAIAANLAQGISAEESIARAKEYITGAIENSLPIGKGAGPVNHFYDLYKKAGVNDE